MGVGAQLAPGASPALQVVPVRRGFARREAMRGCQAAENDNQGAEGSESVSNMSSGIRKRLLPPPPCVAAPQAIRKSILELCHTSSVKAASCPRTLPTQRQAPLVSLSASRLPPAMPGSPAADVRARDGFVVMGELAGGALLAAPDLPEPAQRDLLCPSWPDGPVCSSIHLLLLTIVHSSSL